MLSFQQTTFTQAKDQTTIDVDCSACYAKTQLFVYKCDLKIGDVTLFDVPVTQQNKQSTPESSPFLVPLFVVAGVLFVVLVVVLVLKVKKQRSYSKPVALNKTKIVQDKQASRLGGESFDSFDRPPTKQRKNKTKPIE